MKILVTGGAGFIGSHLVKALNKQGHDVIVLDDLSSGSKDNIPEVVEFIQGDVRQADQLNLPKKIDVVFHLAAQIDVPRSVKDPQFDAQVNVLGTVAILEYARKAGAKKFVYASTGGAIYGTADIIPTTESAEVGSSSPYGISKSSAEQYVRLYSRLFDLDHVILRYSNVYGPGQSSSEETGVIAIFSQQVARSQPLTVEGDGKQTRDFVFVDDVVNVNLVVLKSDVQGTFNISTGKETSINGLVELFKELADYELKINRAPGRKGEERRSCLSNAKAKADLGWEPKVQLKAGLKSTLESLK